MQEVRPRPDVILPRRDELGQGDHPADYPTMSTGWRTFAFVLGRAVLWGGGTAAISFLMAWAVFLFIVPRLLDTPELLAPTFAFLVGYGGLFLGLLLGLVLQIRDVLPLSPWQQALHVVAVIVVVVVAWGTTDLALEPTTVGRLLPGSPANHS